MAEITIGLLQSQLLYTNTMFVAQGCLPVEVLLASCSHSDLAHFMSSEAQAELPMTLLLASCSLAEFLLFRHSGLVVDSPIGLLQPQQSSTGFAF